MNFFYSIGIYSYAVIIHLAAIFNPKAKLWVNGRRNWKNNLASFKRNELPLYWFHCASLGEFEQGRPLIEALKAKQDCQIVVSFFSPSGYSVRKNYELSDYTFYLPIDSKSNAKYLIAALKPTKVFFIKYEFWANYIFELKKQNIPVYLISGLFRENQVFFKWYGGFFRKVLHSFTKIFVQNEASQKLLNTIHVPNTLSGDTRFDRVMHNAKNVKRITAIEDFIQGEKTLVIGSSWEEDERVFMPLINRPDFNYKVIIAPHEIKDKHLYRITKSLKKKSVLYSELPSVKSENADILIIDNIGMLMNVYQYANIAYVGGGFKTGLHNILEPACFGCPVIFGPKFSKFPEASLFIEQQVGFSVATKETLEKVFKELDGKQDFNYILDYMNRQVGATAIIMRDIF
ncbi:3-deoxy-D-manno-octulosonic acid transferase [Putridiphycobacter roseus]|uniref:3-deoxy-D-manno-octulosonic acid transferase n=1 Tax=Putridiphycobacter roseus TaxID=2219161 RepID=A0A2W1NHF8_9FLAO|nr:glycosyltransferase N-terminal domain-containing protein [Putridiphycobacter roseus]PZE18533.1 3-deoxy-D-manno-octulosonic acid transferase [Putridiphycobacter roseus]